MAKIFPFLKCMRNEPFFAIYEQGAICWETFETRTEAEHFLGTGAEIEALYPIAIYNLTTKKIVWHHPELDETFIEEQLTKINQQF
ncbi:MAG: hypothetical protein EAZ95_11475 [Bacteroidetes bacterium]|nr:MAG: hypothetical protein EAZ95_11475 [Bacteroidota bacterium]